jgi:hypothetical protein
MQPADYLKMKKNRFKKRPVISTLLVLFLTAVLIEILLRIINPVILEFTYNFRKAYVYHKSRYTDFTPSTSTLIRLKDLKGNYFLNFILTINELGFRTYDRGLENKLQKNTGEKIIHAVGDSYTMGWGVNYEASYPAILEFMLPSEYRVLNLGLNGYGTIGATEKSLEISEIYSPDFVVYLATENDYDDDIKASVHSKRSYIVHKGYDVLNWFRKHSYLVSTPFALKWRIYYSKSITVSDHNFPREKVSFRLNEDSIRLLDYNGSSNPEIGKESKQALLNYNNYLTRHNVPFVVISLGTGNVSKDIYAFCNEQGIKSYLIEIPEKFKLIKEGHFNYIGNYKFSNFIFNLIEQMDVI